MCARFYRLKDLKDLFSRFGLKRVLSELGLQFNIAPTELTLVIPATEGDRVGKAMKFGWNAPWDPTGMLVNVRAESLTRKPGFRKYLLHHRCLIPADGFFEWLKTNTGSLPYRFGLKGNALFGLAGICTNDTFAIITTEPNALVAPIKERMPVLLRQEDEAAWLDASMQDVAKLTLMLAPYRADLMESA